MLELLITVSTFDETVLYHTLPASKVLYLRNMSE